MSWKTQNSANEINQTLKLLGKNHEVRLKRIYHVVTEKQTEVEEEPELVPQTINKVIPIPIKKKIIPVVFKKPKPELKLNPKLSVPETKPIIEPVIPLPVQPFYQPITQIIEKPSYVQKIQQVRPHEVSQKMTIIPQPAVLNQQIQSSVFHTITPTVAQNSFETVPQNNHLKLIPTFRAPNSVVYKSNN